MALWDTLTDAGSNVLGQVTDTAGSLWESATSGVERAGEFLTDRWVREKTREASEFEREGEALFNTPWGIGPAGADATWGGDQPEPERTAQPQPSALDTVKRFALPAGALVLAGLAAWALTRG